jgi:predicted 3-demethylubiquinone-9 3-methyltransferase (glyoxalase superfamily)
VKGISPFLWFDDGAEEAVDLYVSVFDDAEITDVRRYPAGVRAGWPEGKVMTISFRLQGQDFTALNGGPQYEFSQATSFMVQCETQEEVDRLWDGLSEGGEQQQCGWLVDRFGVTWQIVPTMLGEVISDPDPERSQRALQAMLGMTKLDIAALRAAADGS